MSTFSALPPAYDRELPFVLTFFKSQRFGIDLAGLLIAAVGFYYSTKVGQPYSEVLTGVASSVLFAAGIDLLLALQAYGLHRRQQSMFGRELVRDMTTFVYPDFVMAEETATALAEKNKQLLYRRPRSRFADVTTHRIDLPRVVASNDIRALLYVTDVFRSTSAETEMLVDRTILDSAERSFISFGLSSNDCTHLYLEVDPDPLFTIVDDNAGSEFLKVGPDGQEFRSTPDVQYGLLVRYKPETFVAPDRRWFFVAGLGPLGTTAAAKYLQKHWKYLLKVAGPRDDLLAVVSTGRGSEEFPRLEVLYTRGDNGETRKI